MLVQQPSYQVEPESWVVHVHRGLVSTFAVGEAVHMDSVAGCDEGRPFVWMM